MNVYCTTATRYQPNCSYKYITSYHIISVRGKTMKIRQIKVKGLRLHAGWQKCRYNLTGPCHNPGERPGIHCIGGWDKWCIWSSSSGTLQVHTPNVISCIWVWKWIRWYVLLLTVLISLCQWHFLFPQENVSPTFKPLFSSYHYPRKLALTSLWFRFHSFQV